jgi:G:T/U-mismatch repair DNA glycosylase
MSNRIWRVCVIAILSAGALSAHEPAKLGDRACALVTQAVVRGRRC